MSPYSALLKPLLNALLDQHEQPNRQRAARVKITEARHPDYFADASQRDELHAALADLEKRGWVRLAWVKKHEHLLESVTLHNEHAPALMDWLGRVPQATHHAVMLQQLDAHAPRPGWHAAFTEYIHQQIEAHKNPAPLKLGEADFNADVLSALAALADLTEPTLERVFSVRALHNSKRFDDLRPAIVQVLRRFSPYAQDVPEDDHALLAAHWLERVPEYVLLAGPLTLDVRGQPCVCTPFWPSVAVPVSLLRQARLTACQAHTVLTIENTTAFAAFTAERPAGVLAIFIGGFASPSIIQFLQNLQAFAPGLRWLHWGDMDAGGLRIVRHLRRHLKHVATCGMDAPTFEAHRAQAQPLTPGDTTALQVLSQDPALSAEHALIHTLLQAGHKLEQEAILPTFVLARWF